MLFAGNFGATGVLALAVILIARLLGPADFGTYTLALVIPGFLSIFLGFGVNTAVIRYTAYDISQGRVDEAKRFTLNAIRFLWLSGAAFTLLELVLAGPLAAVLIHRPELAPYVQLVSLTVLSSMFLNTISTTAIGWNQFSLSALSNVATGFVKLIAAPLLIIAGFGVTGALAGHILAYLAGGIFGTGILYFAKLRGAKGEGKFISDLRILIGFGLPLYAGQLVLSLATYLVMFILAFITSNTVYGYYQAASNFIVPITLISSALTTSLFPAFATFDGVRGDTKAAFRHAYRFVAFLITPVIFFILATAQPLVHVLYGYSYNGSVPFLELLSFAYLPVAFGYTVHPAFFNGFNKPKLTMILQLVGGAVLAIAAPLLSLTLNLGVNGLIYSLFLSFFAAWAAGTYFADRYMDARLDLKANGAILLASFAAFIVAYALPLSSTSNVVTIVANLTVFVPIYLTLTPFLRAVKEGDLEIMRHALSGLGPLSRVIGIVLEYEEFILSLGRTQGDPAPQKGAGLNPANGQGT